MTNGYTFSFPTSGWECLFRRSALYKRNFTGTEKLKLKTNIFEAIVVGSSAGGINALTTILATLPCEFPLPIIIVQHLHPNSESYLAQILGSKCKLDVKQADEKETIANGVVYIAPPNYHLLVEEDRTFSLSVEAPVNFSRPAIDVLFDTATYAYRNKLIGIVLTGANSDGSKGLKKIKQIGGYVIVQEPTTAEADVMPRSAIAATEVDKILPLNQIGPYLLQLVNRSKRKHPNYNHYKFLRNQV